MPALSVALHQSAPIPLDVEFACGPGQALAIFGPSGSGKTTILRAIAGLHTPQRGTVRSGADVWLDTAAATDTPPHRRAVGFVFQDYALFPHLSAQRNVMTALGDRPRTERYSEAQRLLALVGLGTLGTRKPADLSGGERQRVALARALARRPRVLLLDEPFAAVDRTTRRRLLHEIGTLGKQAAIPVVLVTHDFDDVVQLATHLVLIDGGRAVAQGTVAEVTSEPGLDWLHASVGLGSVLETTVVRRDPNRGLVELAFDGGVLLAPDQPDASGSHVRVRVPAREIILASTLPQGLSVHNVLTGRVTAVHEIPGQHLCVVRIAVGQVYLLAEVTKDAVSTLQLAPGAPIHALIKSVSLQVGVDSDYNTDFHMN